MKTKKPTPEEILTAIRAKCMDCSGHMRKMVDRCELKDCPLYPYRSRKAAGMENDQRTEIKGQMNMFEMLETEVQE